MNNFNTDESYFNQQSMNLHSQLSKNNIDNISRYIVPTITNISFKKYYKMRHKSRMISLNYLSYEKIYNRLLVESVYKKRFKMI